MTRKAVYSGTFDPFTNGHEYILNTALKFFDECTLLVAIHPSKKSLFSIDEKMEMLKEQFKDEPKVKVDKWEGLLVDYAKKNNINAIVRGLRPTGDFDSEYQMASMNKSLYPDIETIFFLTQGDLNFVSSSLVKEIAGHGGDVTKFVSPLINKKIKEKL